MQVFNCNQPGLKRLAGPVLFLCLLLFFRGPAFPREDTEAGPGDTPAPGEIKRIEPFKKYSYSEVDYFLFVNMIEQEVEVASLFALDLLKR